MIIYKCTNTITEEVYIGQTTKSLAGRKGDHVYEAFKRLRTDKFHTAIRDFGAKAFVWEQVGRAPNKAILAKMERKAILEHQSITFGYNTKWWK